MKRLMTKKITNPMKNSITRAHLMTHQDQRRGLPVPLIILVALDRLVFQQILHHS